MHEALAKDQVNNSPDSAAPAIGPYTNRKCQFFGALKLYELKFKLTVQRIGSLRSQIQMRKAYWKVLRNSHGRGELVATVSRMSKIQVWIGMREG